MPLNRMSIFNPFLLQHITESDTKVLEVSLLHSEGRYHARPSLLALLSL